MVLSTADAHTKKRECALCGMLKSEYTRFQDMYVGFPLEYALLLDHDHFRAPLLLRRKREGAFVRVVTPEDVICDLCSARHSTAAGKPRVPRSELIAAHAVADAKRLALLVNHIDLHCGGKMPPDRHRLAVPGWDGSDETIQVAAYQWLYSLSARPRVSAPSRFDAVRELGAEYDGARWAARVESLMTPVSRMRDKAVSDAKRLALLVNHIDSHCGGKLPPARHRLAVPGWDGSDETIQVDAYRWLYDSMRPCRRLTAPSRFDAVRELGAEYDGARWAARVEALVPWPVPARTSRKRNAPSATRRGGRKGRKQ